MSTATPTPSAITLAGRDASLDWEIKKYKTVRA
jgi:hypothetical protein